MRKLGTILGLLAALLTATPAPAQLNSPLGLVVMGGRAAAGRIPTLKFHDEVTRTNPAPTCGSGTCIVTAFTGGHTAATGDPVFIFGYVLVTGTPNMQCPTGMTQYGPAQLSGSYGIAGCTGLAGVGGLDTSGNYTLAWTGSAGYFNAGWYMAVFDKNTTSGIDATGTGIDPTGFTSNLHTAPSPARVTGVANDSLFSFFFADDNSRANFAAAPTENASATMLYTTPCTASSGSLTMGRMFQENGLASGAPVQRTSAYTSGTNCTLTTGTGAGFSLTLKPY